MQVPRSGTWNPPASAQIPRHAYLSLSLFEGHVLAPSIANIGRRDSRRANDVKPFCCSSQEARTSSQVPRRHLRFNELLRRQDDPSPPSLDHQSLILTGIAGAT